MRYSIQRVLFITGKDPEEVFWLVKEFRIFCFYDQKTMKSLSDCYYEPSQIILLIGTGRYWRFHLIKKPGFLFWLSTP